MADTSGLVIPPEALAYGFAGERSGTISGKTLMLPELRGLLAACWPAASFAEYRDAILARNVLLKPTLTTRTRTVRHLREWYALDPAILLFRTLRALWDFDTEAQPLLALLCAAARNSVLRATAAAVLATPFGERLAPAALAEAAAEAEGTAWNATTRGAIGRNAAASWLQSGHLTGHLTKTRIRAHCRPAATAYALLLGYLCGERGEGLFRTFWVRLLDAPQDELHRQAFAAAQRGWLEYRHAGGVTDVGFRLLLRNEERASVSAGTGQAGQADQRRGRA